VADILDRLRETHEDQAEISEGRPNSRLLDRLRSRRRS
jgi:hypothetical protein